MYHAHKMLIYSTYDNLLNKIKAIGRTWCNKTVHKQKQFFIISGKIFKVQIVKFFKMKTTEGMIFSLIRI